MGVYYINLLLIMGLAFPLCIYKPSKVKEAAYLAVTFGYMWFLATFRFGIGFDYDSYIKIFQRIKTLNGFEALAGSGYEYGFTFLTKAMTLFVKDSTVMYGVYSLLILVPIAVFVFRWCENKWLSVWLYVTLAFFYTNMNFIRQSLACGIIALGYGFLRDKKAVRFFLMVILAALFHKTALIMIPVYVVCHLKLTKKLGAAYGIATILAYAFSQTILDFVTNYIFKAYKDSYYTDAFSPIFLLVPFSIFGGCLALKFIWEKRDPHSGMLLNLMMYSAIIWLFITRHFILERFSMYIYVFTLVALPSAIASLRCSPEEYAQRDEMKRGVDKKPGKEAHAKLRAANAKIADHQKYYWSAVAAALLITMCYNEFGAHVNGFHNVFPYQSVLGWLGGQGTPVVF